MATENTSLSNTTPISLRNLDYFKQLIQESGYAQYATKIGTSTSHPAIGSSTKPVYVNSNGTVTASTSTVGGATKPVYMNSGTITASTSTVGGSAKPIYMSSGTITASSSTIGGSTTPVYMNAGTITACSSSIPVTSYDSSTGVLTITQW